MWLIVGLGNPGEQYEMTRHNFGFMVVDELAKRLNKNLRTLECQAHTASGSISNTPVLLVKPQTYMNLSGVSVKALFDKHKIEDASRVLVLSDDLALPFEKIRIRSNGTSGGQNGLKSIIEKLGTDKFPRLRLGIASEHPITDASNFVLSRFTRKDFPALSETITRAADAVEAILTTSIAEAMSKYN